ISKTNERSNLSPITSRLSPSIDEVIIVTGDKDILQLVDDKLGIKVFMPTKGLSEGKLYGEAEVVERLGVAPHQIPDLKALMGDASDNYPGVAGIGPKTAADLILEFGSIDKLYQSLGSLNHESGIMNYEGKRKTFTNVVLEKLQKSEGKGRR
ncbi:hypothetical protein HY032_00725, partial [Candidatus Gottesmanbacteria bacterium]|nr:hypothetical protein [Candidatus Gottesmanbacteria bacterium]